MLENIDDLRQFSPLSAINLPYLCLQPLAPAPPIPDAAFDNSVSRLDRSASSLRILKPVQSSCEAGNSVRRLVGGSIIHKLESDRHFSL